MPSNPIAPTSPASASSPAPGRHGPWYRRRSILISGAVIAVIAVTVLTDLPSNNTRASNIDSARSVIAEVSTDVQPCNLGLTEALGFYSDVTTGNITAAHRAQIPALIRDDLNACSYTNASIDDLASIDSPNSASGRQLNTITNNALNWCDPDALSAIGAITTLIDQPSNASAHAKLATAEKLLVEDRAASYRNIAKLASYLGASMHSTLKLVQAP